MPAEAFAVLSAFCFGAAHVSSKRGLQDTSVVAATVVVLTVSWLVISASLLFDLPESATASAIAILLVIGLLVPGISRVAVLSGVDRLGPSIAIPIQHGLRPLLSVLGAVLLLGESVSALQALGIVAIISGGWPLSRRPREHGEGEVGMEQAGDSVKGVTSRVATRRVPPRLLGILRPGVIYPVVAALSFATWDLVVKRTLGSLSEPAFAAMISTGAGLMAWVVAVSTVPSVRARWRVGRGVRWLGLSGLLGGVAILSIFHALERGDVAVVAPITSTQPLAVLLLSLLFLRDLERIRATTVVAALAIVVGAILVSS